MAWPRWPSVSSSAIRSLKVYRSASNLWISRSIGKDRPGTAVVGGLCFDPAANRLGLGRWGLIVSPNQKLALRQLILLLKGNVSHSLKLDRLAIPDNLRISHQLTPLVTKPCQ
jgi:hypothetical protein